MLFCVDCDGLTAMGADDCSRCGLLFDGRGQVFVEESLCDDVFWRCVKGFCEFFDGGERRVSFDVGVEGCFRDSEFLYEFFEFHSVLMQEEFDVVL